jgi:hypothetical protein
VGSHSAPKHRVVKREAQGAVFTQSTDTISWTRRYPAITLAALAGTAVGAPGGLAAAAAFTGMTPAQPVAPPRASGPVVPSPSMVVVPAVSNSVAMTPTARDAAAALKAENPYAHTTMGQLEPVGTYGTQEYFTATATQWQNAETIVHVAEQRGMPLYAAVIAVATATQESRLENLTTATNADSLGLFQQRPSQGWGTAAEITDPAHATNSFLAALVVYAPHYMTMDLWESAQAVQRSAFPTAYAQWEGQAAKMVLAIVNGTAPVAS